MRLKVTFYMLHKGNQIVFGFKAGLVYSTEAPQCFP